MASIDQVTATESTAAITRRVTEQDIRARLQQIGRSLYYQQSARLLQERPSEGSSTAAAELSFTYMSPTALRDSRHGTSYRA